MWPPARCLAIGMVASSKGSPWSAIRTLVERTTRLGILSRMDGTNATSAPKSFTKKLRHVPTLLRKTVIGDPGEEMAQGEPLGQRLALKVFFADPYAHGNGAPTRVQMAYCASTCLKAQTCLATSNGS